MKISSIFLLVFVAFQFSYTEVHAIGQESQKICDSIEISGGTDQERNSVCLAIDYILKTLEPFQMEYNWEQPIEKISFHKEINIALIENPVLGEHFSKEELDNLFGVHVGVYFPERRTIHMLDFESFKKFEKPGFTIDYKLWEGMLPIHEITHYFTHQNSNGAALTFFEEALSYYVEVNYVGIEQSKTAKLYNPNSHDESFMTEALYHESPFAFSIVSWEVISKNPKYYIPRILNGEINLDYIDYARMKN